VIRLGRIGYVNMAPVFYRLEAEVEEIVGVPTDLNRALLAGECDLAPISSIEYARNAERLRILPRLCVSSEGAVDSIQLVSRTPLEHVRTVAVTPESATSVVLTKVLLPEAEHVPLGEEAEATLLIGDAALKSAFEDPTPHHDLGRLWLERTGLPMVFAVWAAPDRPLPGLGELEEALVAFDGSVVVVSHDRYFLNRVCASILAFEGDGVVRYSIGDYDYYLEKRAERLASSAAPPTTASSTPGSERLITAQRPRKLKWSERQELETIEDKILAAEEDLVRLEAQFADPDFYTKHGQHWQMFDAQLQTARENVSQLYSRWEELERIRAER